MQLPTQEQFVKDCLAKYWFTEIPDDQKWEIAHFPLPRCSGEDDTVPLWSADHTVQGLLQSVELDHKCFYHSTNGKDLYNLETYYPEYLELFKQLKSQFSRRQGKIAGKKSAELKVGVHARTTEQRAADGKIGAARSLELGVGVHASGMASTAGKIGGKITSAQKWQCLVTGHISSPGPLSHYQKARGIDTNLRVRILDLQG